MRDAVTLGGTVTAAHTTSVLVLGGVLTVPGGTVPGRLYPLLRRDGGLLVVALGMSLLRNGATQRALAAMDTDRPGHGHGHGHGHDHGDGDDHGHEHGRAQTGTTGTGSREGARPPGHGSWGSASPEA